MKNTKAIGVGLAAMAVSVMIGASSAQAGLAVSEYVGPPALGTDTFKAEPGQGIPTNVRGFVNGGVTAVHAGQYTFTYLGAGNASYINAFVIDTDFNLGNGFDAIFCNKGGSALCAAATPINTTFTTTFAANTLIPFYYIFDQNGASGGPHQLNNGGIATGGTSGPTSTGAYLANVRDSNWLTNPNPGNLLTRTGTDVVVGLSDECHIIPGITTCGVGGTDTDFQDLSVLIHQVPEPGTLALLGMGLVGLGLARRRKAA
ncbi:PEP-CTERM sorting domain-containing protein [Falsiroseomonas oryzae]|uniref:PEP-CTERM sorting domain-containing protein n=1 Tax=Falsiroseomonas oryzae TaxID=2766473 RepID=UPI0022EAEBEB|nr:PEP-CTERM sorting domain-containing protein [Roseomonas sp. MO-31]